MSGLFSGGTKRASTPAPSTSLRVQSSVYGKPMALGWGRFRIAGNLLWYGDFNATAQPSQSGGGKGGGGSSSNSGTYNYSAAVAIGLCEGPVQRILGAWNDKTGATLASLNLTPFLGAYDQTEWGYLDSGHAAVAEDHVIPAASPYEVQVEFHDPFMRDYGVTDANGNVFTAVGSNPGADQYSVSDDGLYSFNAANAGVAITIEYTAGDQQPQNEALTYRGTAYVAAGPMALGTSAELPTLSFEVSGACSQRMVTTNWTVTEPYSIVMAGAVDPAGNEYSLFISDGGVADAEDAAFTLVTSNPASGQYTLEAGSDGAAYGFSSADAGRAVDITYTAFGQDADPAEVIADFLTNPYYGLGFPAARLGDLSTYSAYCIASGLMVSPALTDANGGDEFLKDLMTGTNAEFVWSGGKLIVVPYGDQAVAANGASYVPPASALYAIGDDDLLPNQGSNPNSSSSASNADPVQVTRLRPADQMNDIKIGWLDRANQYNPAVADAQDDAAIDLYGLRSSDLSQLNFFTSAVPAMLSAQLQLGRQQVRNTYVFTVGQQFILLDPMDLIEVTDGALGLANAAMRITEITENQDGSLNLLCEDYLAGTATVPLYGSQVTGGYQPNYNVVPPAGNAPVIFEPPLALTGGDTEIWLVASGGTGWGGCDVWVSTDGDSYAWQGRIEGPARQGVLTAPLAAVTPSASGATIDTANSLSVDLSESGGQLVSATQAEAQAGSTLSYVDGELVGYQNAGLLSGDTYALSWLVRGMYGTTIAAHAAGSPFARLDSGVLKWSYTPDRIGTTLYIKLLPFNYWGGGEVGIDTVEPVSYLISGADLLVPLPDVTGLSAGYVAGIFQINWNPVSDPRAPVDYEIRLGSSWAAGSYVTRTPHAQFPTLGDGTYWVAAHYQVPRGPDVYSADPASILLTGSQLTSNIIASHSEAGTGWSGSFSGTALEGGDLILASQPDVIDAADILGVSDIFTRGDVGSGTYRIAVGHQVDIGRVAPCQVLITMGAVLGLSTNANDITRIGDITRVSDLIGFASGSQVSVVPQIRLSQTVADDVFAWDDAFDIADAFTGQQDWADWQNWIPGSYLARAYDCRVVLGSTDPGEVLPVLTDLVFGVDVPDRVDSGVNVAVASGGTAIAFSVPFNGGPGGAAVPLVGIDVIGGSAGDTPLILSRSAAGFSVQIVNGGIGVPRMIDWQAQGY